MGYDNDTSLLAVIDVLSLMRDDGQFGAAQFNTNALELPTKVRGRQLSG
jgi:hypothetical protein